MIHVRLYAVMGSLSDWRNVMMRMQSVMMAVRQPVKLKIVLLYVPVVDGLFQGLMKRVQLYAGMVC